MLRNTTKDKGDKGLAFVIADLVQNGYYICLPISEHLPFDLIAVTETGKMARIQAKFRVLQEQVIRVKMASVYSTAKGTHVRPHDMGAFDAYAIYCPDTGNVYYVPTKGLSGSELHLRVGVPVLKTKRKAKSASDYRDVGKIFE